MSVIEDVIVNVGWGLYHNLIVAIASASAASQATAWSTQCFALPMAFCDMILPERSFRNLGAYLYFGIALGSCPLCFFSDIAERKSLFTSSLLVCFVTCLVAGFAHGTVMIEFCMFCLGSGLTANRIIMKVYLIEHLPFTKRGRYVAITDVCFGVTLLISALIASLMTPSVIHQRSFDMRIITWRLMFGLSGAVSIIIACTTALLRSSPRHLFFKRDYSEAVSTIKYIYSINNSKHSQTFDVRPLQLVNAISDYNLRFDPYATTFSEQLFDLTKRIFFSLLLTFRKKFAVNTILAILIRIAFPLESIHVGLWLVNVIHQNKSMECSITPLNLLYLEGATNENRCKISLSETIYFDFVGLIASTVVAYTIVFLLVDRLGRKPLLVVACLLCTGSALILLAKMVPYWLAILSSIAFMMGYSIALSVLDIITLESYPTAIRCTTMVETQMPSKMCASFCLIFLNANCRTTLTFTATSMLVATILSVFLQELKNQPMIE
ncbi:uncharacterized protein LOC108735700 [Agrilus planipennis]|uniref:Uncharacterized protein LOC108735700 n=1 Tax=Agrilus planipennis TaxID=224129 RepID=A0A1W4WH77_AGRPL|nr:uncharacterized protein LOC108735700 [Agrilus planipennis]